MKYTSTLRAAIALALLTAASPALASDFSGMAWFFVLLIAIVGIFVVLIVMSLRQMLERWGAWADGVSAVVLAAFFAPTTFAEAAGSTYFTLFPAWMTVMFDGNWGALFPGPAISFLVTTLLFFAGLKHLWHRRMARAAEPAA